MLLLLVGAVQGHRLQADGAAVRRLHQAILQPELVRLHTGDEMLGRVLPDLPGHLLRGLQHRAAGDVGGAGGVGPGVEGGEVRVAAVDQDLFQLHAQGLRRDLGQDRVRSSAQVRGPHQQVEAAVVVHLDAGRAHVQPGDARAVHADGQAHPPADVGALRVLLPGGILAALPADGLGAHVHALGQAAGADGLLEALSPLSHGLGHGQLLAHLHPVEPLELQGIQPGSQGQLLHVLLQGKLGLGRAVAPEGPGHRLVGVDHRTVEAGRGQPVGAQGPEAGDHLHGEAVGAIGPGVPDDLHVHAHQLALLVDAAAEAQDLGVAGAGAGELLGPGVLEAHRAARGDGQVGGQVLDEHLLLAAEAAADAGLHHPDAAHGQANEGGDHAAHVEGHLGAGADDQPVVLVPPAHHHVGLDAGLLHLVDPVLALVDEVGIGQGRVHVPVLHVDVDGDVALGVVDVHRVRLVVDHRRAGLHGLLRVEDRGQHLVLHFDELQGLLHQLRRLGRHDGHPVPHVADLAVQAHLVVGGRVGVALAAAGVDDPLHVLVGEHRVDAGQGLGLGGVDGDDAGVGVGAGEEAAVEHARQLHIVREDGPALGQLHRVHLGLRLVHHLGLRRGHGAGHRAGAGLGLGPGVVPAFREQIPAVGGRRPLPGRGRVHDLDLQRGHLLPAQLGRGPEHRLHGLHVAGAAAEHPGDGFPHLGLGGIGVLVQELLGGQDLGGGAVAALDGPGLDELLLEGMEPVAGLRHAGLRVQPLQGDDAGAVGLGGQQDPAVHQAVAGGLFRGEGEEHRVRAGVAGLVPVLHAEVAQPAQEGAQQLTRVGGDGVLVAVDGQGDLHGGAFLGRVF